MNRPCALDTSAHTHTWRSSADGFTDGWAGNLATGEEILHDELRTNGASVARPDRGVGSPGGTRFVELARQIVDVFARVPGRPLCCCDTHFEADGAVAPTAARVEILWGFQSSVRAVDQR